MMTREKAFAGIALALAGGLAGAALSAGAAQSTTEAPAGVPHYSVVETQGFNLLVTDNASNRLYFYTVDRNQNVGAELKLRASIDLNQVGQQVIRPQHAPNM